MGYGQYGNIEQTLKLLVKNICDVVVLHVGKVNKYSLKEKKTVDFNIVHTIPMILS